jgi:hypothetical protein
VAIKRRRPPHRGPASTSMSNARRIRRAHAQWGEFGAAVGSSFTPADALAAVGASTRGAPYATTRAPGGMRREHAVVEHEIDPRPRPERPQLCRGAQSAQRITGPLSKRHHCGHDGPRILSMPRESTRTLPERAYAAEGEPSLQFVAAAARWAPRDAQLIRRAIAFDAASCPRDVGGAISILGVDREGARCVEPGLCPPIDPTLWR